MAEQLILKNLEFIKVLPAWAQDLSYKYCSKTANLYLIHGNVRDFLPNTMYEDEFIFVRIQEFISDVLFGNQDIIVFFDRSSGINFCTQEMRETYLVTMRKLRPGVADSEFLTSDPVLAFRYLEEYFLQNIPRELRIVLIVDYAETLVPNSPVAELSDEDRFCLVTLNRWSHDPIFTQGDVSVLLLTEALGDLSPRLVRSPSTVKISIPIPDETVRRKFLTFLQNKGSLMLETRLRLESVARITAGLNLMNLNQLAAESYQEDKPISLEYLGVKKKEILENEAGGLLEFIESEHDLSMVAGHDFVKERFRKAARAIKKGRLDVLPMGYLMAGPVGTGKTFIVTAFAKEIGIPVVKFRNVRSRWTGVNESALEKILNILKAMAPVGVMIDEADALLGTTNRQGERRTDLFPMIAAAMGNTEYRGRIIWFLITSRPDLLPIDLKRQGRAEEHLALFFPESPSEKEELFLTLVSKLKLKVQDFAVIDLLKRYKYDLSGADLESILIRAKFHAAMEGHVIITKADVEETLRDFIPPAYPHEIELQNLVAALECTSRDMVPKRYQGMEKEKIVTEIKTLKELLGEN